MTDKLDLNTVFQNSAITIAPEEHVDDRASRIIREDREHLLEFWKSCAIFTFSLLFIVVISIISINFGFLDRNIDESTRLFARSVLGAIVAGVAGFLWGKTTSKVN